MADKNGRTVQGYTLAPLASTEDGMMWEDARQHCVAVQWGNGCVFVPYADFEAFMAMAKEGHERYKATHHQVVHFPGR